MEDCVFCNIAAGKVPATIYHQDDDVLVFQDILPKAPVHLLIIPRQHIESVTHVDESHALLLGKMILVAKQVAEKQGIADSGYRLQFNVGKDGGQIVKHVHLHLLGGKKIPE